jgi:serine/threonine-protein kinase
MLACSRCGSSYTKDQEFCGIDGERLSEQATDPLIGRTVDRYKIVETIGEGGMARVYRARHVYLEQDFAVKILFGDIASDRNLARRFQREAQAASRIKHANVVSISDFGASGDGLIFMAMELIAGGTLTDAIKSEGAMPPARAAFLVRQIAEGLAAAHALGFVHRDLKPKNVMLIGAPGAETVKILDFGLVMFTENSDHPSADPTHLTKQGQVFGTPAYMSPEQVSGGTVGPAADLYSLGVILYQLLAGSVPFSGQPGQIAMHHMSSEPPPLLFHEGLGPLAMRLLAKDPAKRPASAVEVIAQLERPDRPERPAQPGPQPEVTFPIELSLIDERSVDVEPEPNRRAMWLGAFGVGCLIALAGYYVLEEREVPAVTPPVVIQQPPPPEPEPETQPEPEPPPPPPPPPAVRPVVVDRSPPADRKQFDRRDQTISYRLTKRGLSWRDLAEAESEAAQAWGLWRIGAETPTVAELERRADELTGAVAKLKIDRTFLEAKLERVRKTLGDLPDSKRDVRYTVLVDRFNALRSRAARSRADERLAAEITLLESDAQIQAAGAPETTDPAVTDPEIGEDDAETDDQPDSHVLTSTNIPPF